MRNSIKNRMNVTGIISGLFLAGSLFAAASAANASTVKEPIMHGEVTERQPPESGYAMWSAHPAASWLEAFPVGNGHIGAMVYGGVPDETITLNDTSLWSGSPSRWVPPNGAPLIKKIRAAVLAGNYTEADQLCTGLQGPWTQSFMPMATLHLHFEGLQQPVTEYRRMLDLNHGLIQTRFQCGDTIFSRVAFASYPARTFVLHMEASSARAISFTATFSSLLHSASKADGPTRFALVGRAPSNVLPDYVNSANPVVYSTVPDEMGMSFRVEMQAVTSDGNVTAGPAGLHVSDATEVTLFVASSTSFNGWNKPPATEGRNPVTAVRRRLNSAAAQSYKHVLQVHEADYQALFNRVDLHLGDGLTEDESIADRIKRFDETDDPQLAALMFQYGRYLLISCSRAGGQPANLQGMWNEMLRPPWSSNYTTNINTEMNYWPAEVCNIPETELPLYNLLRELSEAGRITATRLYGSEGWCLDHNTDIWCTTWPVGLGAGWPGYSNWPMGGAWLCRNLWEHYAFTGDRQFLRKTAWPIMKGAAEFCLSWLIPDGKGHLVTCPSTSPEHAFYTQEGKTAAVSMASTIDMAIIHDLFTHSIATCKLLNVDRELEAQMSGALAKLYPPPVSPQGALDEWYRDFKPQDAQHRHMSHLYGLYPASEITEYGTPALYDAARKALVLRGDGGTGWSLTWKISLWARVHDGAHAYMFIRKLISPATGDAGVYPNLFDSCPPFQMDGNWGYTAGVAEMLVQSQAGGIEFLPALPPQWPEGSVRGLCARGGFIVDMTWTEGHLSSGTIHSRKGGVCNVLSVKPITVTQEGTAVTTVQLPNHLWQFNTRRGGTYTVTPAS